MSLFYADDLKMKSKKKGDFKMCSSTKILVHCTFVCNLVHVVQLFNCMMYARSFVSSPCVLNSFTCLV